MNIFEFFRRLRIVVKRYELDMQGLYNRTAKLETMIRDRTVAHIDVHQKVPSQVILIGKYRGQDYVKVYSIREQDFKDLIAHLREMSHYARLDKVDAWPAVSALIKREVDK